MEKHDKEECVIDELWLGNIAPSKCFLTDNKIVQELLRDVTKAQSLLEKTLSPSQKKLFDDYMLCEFKLADEIEKSSFRTGYCLAYTTKKQVEEILAKMDL